MCFGLFLDKVNTFIGRKSSKILLYNFFSLSSLQVLNYLLPLITLPYLVKILGIEKYGLLAFANSLVAYFQSITDYGFNLSATRDIAINRKSKKKIAAIYSSVITAKMFLVLICFIFVFFVVQSFDRFYKDSIVYVLVYGVVVGNSLFSVWFFQGMEKMSYVAILNAVAKIVFTVAIFIFVKSDVDFYIVPLINALGYIFVGFLSLILIRYKFNIPYCYPGIKSVINEYKKGFNIFLTQFMPNLYNNTSQFLLGFVCGNAILGGFSVAMSIVNVCNSIGYVMTNVFFPYLSGNFNGFEKIRKLYLFVGFLLTCLSVLFFIFFSERYFFVSGQVVLVGSVLSLSVFPFFMSFVYLNNYLIIKRKDRDVRDISVFVSLIGFLFVLTIFIIGLWGAVLAIIVSRYMFFQLSYNKYRKLMEFEKSNNNP